MKEILEQALFDLEECETEQDLSDVRKSLEEAGLLKAPSSKKKLYMASHCAQYAELKNTLGSISAAP